MSRVLAAVSLATVLSGFAAAALPAPVSLANNGGQTCVGGDNRNKPGYGMGVCIDTVDTTRL